MSKILLTGATGYIASHTWLSLQAAGWRAGGGLFFRRAVLMLAAEDIPVEVEDVLLRSVEPVTEVEWQYLVAHQAWAAEHAPNHPKAEPRRAVDFNTIPLPF